MQEWIDALDKIEALNQRAVVASHKRPENEHDCRIIEQIRQYIRDVRPMSGNDEDRPGALREPVKP